MSLRTRTRPGVLMGPLALSHSLCAQLAAQDWKEVVRGSWVEIAKPSKGDVVLAARGRVCEIVIGAEENSAVRQAGAFLAVDIERISGYRMYTEVLERYQRDPSAFNLPQDVIIVWPDNNDGRMRALPSATGKWKHGIYYRLAYFGGDRTMQSVHIVSPAVVASEFRRSVAAGTTEFLLVNVSELREFVMEARMIAEIAWDAPATLAGPDAAQRYVNWWSREYFGARAAGDVAAVYGRYYSILDNPTKLWLTSNAFHRVIERLYARVGLTAVTPIASDSVAAVRARKAELTSVLATAHRVDERMSRPERQYFFENAELPLLIQLRQAEATLKLLSALEALDTVTFWTRAESALAPLEQLETEIRRAEHPPFENWYRKTWIRRETTPFNVHRPFEELRVFLSSEGREKLAEPPGARRLDEAQARRFFPAPPVY